MVHPQVPELGAGPMQCPLQFSNRAFSSHQRKTVCRTLNAPVAHAGALNVRLDYLLVSWLRLRPRLLRVAP